MSIQSWISTVELVLLWLGMSGVLSYGARKARKNGQSGVAVLSGFLATAIFVIGALFFYFILSLNINYNSDLTPK
jgi:uncharacterized BrkB/YihY/UPF0761 family membrane protein